MMPRCARVLALAAAAASLAAGCAPANAPTADPEAQHLSPNVVIIDEPQAEEEAAPEAPPEAAPEVIAKDPNTQVITFQGADATPGMADEVTAPPKRDPLPSMMSDVIHPPTK